MERTDNLPKWDAKRLVQEYLKKADLIDHYKRKPFDDMVWSNQIRVKRIASALRAFIGMEGVEEKPIDLITSVFDGWNFEHILEYSPFLEEERDHLNALLKDAIADDHRFKSIMNMEEYRRREDPSRMEREKYRDRGYMLRVLFEYRVASEKLISCFDGMMEGTVGAYLGYLAVKGSCLNPLKDHNDKIDDIIVLLLGEKFKKSFSEEEVKANYGYPKETDYELDEWDCDNE